MSGDEPAQDGKAPEVELFTHPICSGCQEAVDALSKLARSGQIRLSTCNLGTSSGRRRAEQLGVSSVPTVRRGDLYRVLLHKTDLEELVAELSAASAAGT